MRRWLALGAVALIAAAVALVWQLRAGDETPAPVATPTTTTPAHPIAPPALRPDPTATMAALDGTVRDGAGAPIAAARVCLIERVATRCTLAGADGHYAFDEVPAVTTAIGASAANRRPVIEYLDRHPGQTTIDLALTSVGVRVRGTVIGLDGKPIANARVTSIGTRTETTDTGTFELWAAPGRVNLRVVADGYAETPRWVTAPSTIQIVLVPESSLAGTVVDDATGAPLANVRVGIESELAEVITARDGTFRFAHLAPGRYQLRASTPRLFGVAFELALGLGEHRTGVIVRMRPAHQVSVKIVNADGSPCMGEVRLEEWGSSIGTPWRDGAVTRIDGVPAGRYMVEIWCAAQHPPTRAIDVSGDLEISIAVADPRAGTLRGRVIAPNRSESVRVWVRSDKMMSRAVQAEEDGAFAVALPAGRYTVVAGGWKPETPEEVVDIVANTVVERTLQLPPSTEGRLIVLVVDRDGRPLPHTVMMLECGPLHSSATTDGEGTASVALEAGGCSIEIDATKATAQVVAGTERQVRISVDQPQRAIRGTVVDADKRPVAGALVSFERDVTRFAITGADGAFSLAGGTPGSYVALVAYKTGSSAHAAGFGDPATPVTLTLGGSASIAGTVVRSDGSVPERFDVIIRTPRTAMFTQALGRTTRTYLHTRGAFLIDELPAGVFELGAAINGIETWSDVSVGVAERKTGVTLTIPPLAAITGRVLDAGSRAPIADARLFLRCDRNSVPLAFTHADQRSASDGRFTISDLPPGPCSVEVAPPEAWLRANHQISVPERGVGDVGELALARARI